MRSSITEEQIAYAVLLNWLGKAGLLVLVLTYAIYLTALVPPQVAIEELPQVWSMPVGEYVKRTGMPTGWAWLGMMGHSDCLTFVGLALLASATIICYLRIIPVFLRRREIVYGVIALLEILVLAFAASGILRAG